MPAKRFDVGQITHRDLALPTKRAKPFNHPDWIYELKHDGYRVLAIWDGKAGKLLSRRGNDLLPWFPEIASDLVKLQEIAIDGELVIQDTDGRPDFHKLRGRCAIRDPGRIARTAIERPAAVFAFDLLAWDGADYRAHALVKRKALLHKLVKPLKRICYTQHIGENGERLFAEADRLELEGIIAKKADSTYRRGRVPTWVKIKTAHGRHIDAERAKWNA